MPSVKKITFTPSLFFKYSTCPHWIWHDYFGDPTKKGEVPALYEKLLEQGVLHEEEYVKNLTFTEVEEVDSEKAFNITLDLMSKGVDLIYQGVIQYSVDGVVYRGRPDLLEKQRRSSKFGDYHYVPIDIKSSKDIKPEQWMQLVLYAKILDELQGVFPETVAIINRDHERIPFIIESKHREKTFARIGDILDVIKGVKPPLKLTSTCKNSPWYNQCVSDAEQANDIALLYRLDSRALSALREAGIKTISDAANMRITELPKIPYASPSTLERIKLQAQSLIDKQLKWMVVPELPDTSLKIYFDIEGDPLLEIQYLWGFWITGDSEGKYAKVGDVRKFDDGKYYVYFLAEQLEDESIMWKKFLQWLELLPNDDLTVFHYHHYEVDQCRALEKNYGGSDALHIFMQHFVDLSPVVIQSVIFPLYFYSIKDIAKSPFLNFKWRHAKAGGAQSIFWYEQWLETHDRKILSDIIDYNEDDVRATEHLYHWFVTNTPAVSPYKINL